jgi:mannonate dehydratase
MRFDFVDFAVFDIHILQRKGAAEDFPEDVRDEAGRRFATMDDARRERLSGKRRFRSAGRGRKLRS